MVRMRIREVRKQFGWTQKRLAEELAKVIGRSVPIRTLSRWELGQNIPHARTLQLLANLLGVSVPDLFAGSGNKEVT